MQVKHTTITIRELVENYNNDEENGVVAFAGNLNIRPPYQREFVYKPEQQAEVIRTVRKGFPLNVMYWADIGDGKFEIIDGQQRTLSICEFVKSRFSVKFDDGNLLNFSNLTDDQQNQILDYELTVYQCSGTDSEKLAWFKTINIAGETLTEQELRNAVYSGSWITDAKRYFSKTGCVVYQQFGDYLNGTAIRQDYLETAIKWIASQEKQSIEKYMSEHQQDENASPLYQYIQEVFAWVQRTFSNQDKSRKKLMKGQDWGVFYNQFKDQSFNASDLEKRIIELIDDEEVNNQKGIYPYLLTGQEKYLNLRAFSDKDRQKMFQRQDGICPHCQKEFKLDQMDADHIIPWSKGGKTTLDNGQLLCRACNQRKSNK